MISLVIPGMAHAATTVTKIRDSEWTEIESGTLFYGFGDDCDLVSLSNNVAIEAEDYNGIAKNLQHAYFSGSVSAGTNIFNNVAKFTAYDTVFDTVTGKYYNSEVTFDLIIYAESAHRIDGAEFLFSNGKRGAFNCISTDLYPDYASVACHYRVTDADTGQIIDSPFFMKVEDLDVYTAGIAEQVKFLTTPTKAYLATDTRVIASENNTRFASDTGSDSTDGDTMPEFRVGLVFNTSSIDFQWTGKHCGTTFFGYYAPSYPDVDTEPSKTAVTDKLWAA